MTGDMIDTFRKSTQAVNQEFNVKLKLRKVLVTESHAQGVDMSIKNAQGIFRLRHFAAQC